MNRKGNTLCVVNWNIFLPMVQYRLEKHQNVVKMYKWLGGVFNEHRKSNSSSIDIDSVDEKECTKVLQKSLCRLENRMLECKVAESKIAKHWKCTKQLVKDSEYRRQKYKLTLMTERLDAEMPYVSKLLDDKAKMVAKRSVKQQQQRGAQQCMESTRMTTSKLVEKQNSNHKVTWECLNTPKKQQAVCSMIDYWFQKHNIKIA